MKKTALMNKVTRAFHTTGIQIKKHSPEILVVAGIVGTVASTVMACRATTKAHDILEETKEKIDAIHEVKEEHADDTEYTEEDYKKAIGITYARTGLEFAKLYGPSVVLGVTSIACILTSHNMMRKRNVAIAAAYTAIDHSFKEYRGRVVERFGEALDKELRYNIKTVEVEEKVMNEDGTEQIVKKNVEIGESNQVSDYARFFDDGCLGWEKNAEYNLMYLKQIQSWANDKLEEKGHLFLNEVYEMLGIPQTKAGAIVGWVRDSKTGDGYVDFGIYDMNRPKCRDFVNGYERTILLDFNVDGVIYDLLA